MKISHLTKCIRNGLPALMLAVSLFSPTVWANTHSAPTSQTAVATSGFELLKNSINKSPNDKAIYQGIQLKNGMTVLLISDEKANKSLMSLAVPIGSMEDPISQQGLAHYLEHMILMGSKNYPETNSLDAFLSQNGGYNNASTTADRTAYYLEVNNNAFDEAVDRLADAFANPLLSESNAKKEVNAVNAEMVRAKSSDGFLLHSVELATSNPEHPITKFTVGNNETLSDKPNSKLQTELEQFYQRYYSSNLVKAVLYSNQSIEQLVKLAEKTLGKMPNKQLAAPTVSVPLFREQDNGVVVSYKPIRPMKLLAISFDMPNDEARFANKTGEYLAYVLNNNTDGTLSDYLIKQGWSDSGVAAETQANVSRNRGAFVIYVNLTDKGVGATDKIISLIFQQIENIKKAGVQESYYKELQESLKQEFQHLQVEKSGSYVESLAEQMLHYPLENILDADFIAEKMDTPAINEKLQQMSLENARITLVNPAVKTDKKTPYFEAGYAVAKISAEQKAKWLDFSQNPELKLPALNPYFATDFSLIAKEQNRLVPALIEQNKGTQIYAMPSHYFAQDPKAIVSLEFDIANKNDEIKSYVAASILNYMNGLAQTKLNFQSSVANMEASVSPAANGLAMSLSGYTQHLAKLAQDSLTLFSQFELSEKFLAQAKERVIEALDRRLKEGSLKQANDVFSQFGAYPYFEDQAIRNTVEQITLADIQAQRERVLNNATGMNLLSVGNLSDEQVRQLTESLNLQVKNQNSERVKQRYLDINQSQRKLNLVKKVPNEDNALVIYYMSKGYEKLAGTARASLLKDIIGRWYFDDLRTEKQLGYVVYAFNSRIGKTAGLSFAVQSPNTTPKGIMEHNNRFFKETADKLNAMSEQEFVKYRESLVAKLERKPESLEQEFSRYTSDVDENNAKFDSLPKLIDLVKGLQKQDLIDFYQNTVMQPQGLVFASQALGTKATEQDAVPFAGFEKVESIEKLQKEFELKVE